MCFIFELNKPLLLFSVYNYRNFNRACVDFITFIKVCYNTALFKHLGADAGHIHKANILFTVTVNLISDFKILIKSFFNCSLISAVLNHNAVKLCAEGGMAAVVAPICIYNLKFCKARISFFRFKIITHPAKVCHAHCKPH